MTTNRADRDHPRTQAARARPVPTIHDVARASGVAIGTASKALNGGGRMRPETRARVRQAAVTLGFRPNDLMLSLLRRRSFTVGLLSDDSALFSMQVLKGIENALAEAKLFVFLCWVGDDPERERQHIDTLLAKQIDGLIVTGRILEARPPIDLYGTHVPVVYAYTRGLGPETLSLIPDDAHGARLATEHLIGHGRRRFAHITGPADWEATRARRAAIGQVLAEHGLALEDRAVLAGPSWGERWGYQGASMLLDRQPCPDAIICGNDAIARGTIDALRERGAWVPEDVAIVGWDNRDFLAEEARPPLTSVDMNLYELGRIAGTKLLAMIDGQEEVGLSRLPCTLVVRESCGCVQPVVTAAGSGLDGP